MPLIIRPMKCDRDGRSRVGNSSATLGVRVEGERRDITPDSENKVHPGVGGMSVSPSIKDLPPTMVPIRFRDLYPAANGPESLFVWKHGEGSFIEALLTPTLRLRPDKPGHGLVEPAHTMSLREYETAIAATRTGWIPVEPADTPGA